MSVFCAEARGSVMHRRTDTTALMVRRAPSVGTMPISIILLFFASLRVLRELRANQLALRSLCGSRQHRRSREVREDREGPRRTATPGVVSPRVHGWSGASRGSRRTAHHPYLGTSEHAVKTHLWIAKQGLPLDRQSMYEMLQILRVDLFAQVPHHQRRTPPLSYSDADFEPIPLVLL